MNSYYEPPPHLLYRESPTRVEFVGWLAGSIPAGESRASTSHPALEGIEVLVLPQPGVVREV